MDDRRELIAKMVVRALKVSAGDNVCAMMIDGEESFLPYVENAAKEAGAQSVFLYNAVFGSPVNYLFENELQPAKAVRIFAGGLPWGMEYEYATDFHSGVVQGIAMVNYAFMDRSNWISLEYPGKLKADFCGMTTENLTEMMFDSILCPPTQLKRKQANLKDKLQKGSLVSIEGDDVNLTFSIKGKRAISCYGRYNVPDGEVFVAPVEGSMNGNIHFESLDWGLLQNVELEFSDGKVVSATAKTKQQREWLKVKLEIDDGAAKACEFAIGTNENVTHMVGDPLFDEKKYGTFHIALGGGYGSNIVSIRHWDMVKDSNTSYAVKVDGDKVLEDGKILI